MQTRVAENVDPRGTAALRDHNLSTVLRHLRDVGPAGRSEIAIACGLGISTLTSIINDLRERGLVSEGASQTHSRAGRPVTPLWLDGDMWVAIGLHLDVDGVRARITTVGGRLLGEFHVRHQVGRRPARVGLTLLKRALTRAVSAVEGERKIIAVEVSIPGSVARDVGVVGVSVPLDWHNVAVGQILREHLNDLDLPKCHLGIDNDVNHAALAAIRTELAGPTSGSCVYFGGERGVGGAILVDGELFRGSHGGAGEFGHLAVEIPGRPCYCGRFGCLETRLSLDALLTDSGIQSPEEARATIDADPYDACRLLLAGIESDARVRDAIAEAGHFLGRAVEITLSVLNPDVVLIGDHFARIGDPLIANVRAAVSTTINFAAFRTTRISVLPDVRSRVVHGAAIAAADACLNQPMSLTSAIA